MFESLKSLSIWDFFNKIRSTLAYNCKWYYYDLYFLLWNGLHGHLCWLNSINSSPLSTITIFVFFHRLLSLCHVFNWLQRERQNKDQANWSDWVDKCQLDDTNINNTFSLGVKKRMKQFESISLAYFNLGNMGYYVFIFSFQKL